MTRTVFYGEPDEESRRVYETVRQAQEAAIKAVRPGVTFASIDRAARRVIEEAGYGECTSPIGLVPSSGKKSHRSRRCFRVPTKLRPKSAVFLH